MNHLFSGPHYLAEGFKLIFKPGLKRFLIIPLLINLILFALLFMLSKHFFSLFSHWLQQHLPHWLQWLSGLFWIFYAAGYLLFITYAFVTLANIVAAPFLGLLAEKVEFYLTGITHEQTWLATFKDIPRSIGRQLAILGFYLPRAILLLLCFFIPIVHFAAAVLWFLFNAWFMTLQYIDFPTENNRIPLARVRDQLREKRGLTLGFGMSVLFLSPLPLVNLFVIPAAVAGATKLWVEKFKNTP